jgi:hypothetical protein
MGDPDIRVYEATRKAAITDVGPVFIYRARRAPDLGVIRWLKREFEAHRARHPAGGGVVFYIDPEPGARPGLDGQVREAFLDAIRKSAAEQKGVLVVFNRPGFLGAGFRALAAGLLLAARIPTPMRISGTLPEGLPWFIDRLRLGGVTVDAAAISDAVGRLQVSLATT